MIQKIKTVVDRIEGDLLVCCDDETLFIRHLPLSDFPSLRPNDVLLIEEENGRILSVLFQKEETEMRLKIAKERMNRLFKRKN